MGRALSDHNLTRLLQLKMNPAAAPVADSVLAKRTDSEAQQIDHLEWARTRNTSRFQPALECICVGWHRMTHSKLHLMLNGKAQP